MFELRILNCLNLIPGYKHYKVWFITLVVWSFQSLTFFSSLASNGFAEYLCLTWSAARAREDPAAMVAAAAEKKLRRDPNLAAIFLHIVSNSGKLKRPSTRQQSRKREIFWIQSLFGLEWKTRFERFWSLGRILKWGVRSWELRRMSTTT